MRSSDLSNGNGQLDQRFQPIFIWMKFLGISLTGERRFIPEGYTFKYTEGNNVSDRVPRIDLVIDIYWRVGFV